MTLAFPETDPAPPVPRTRLLRLLRACIRILYLVTAAWAVVTMAWTWASIYFEPIPADSSPPIVTPAATHTYEVAASVGLLTAVVCLVDALLARSGWRLAGAVLLAVLTVGSAVLFAVPEGRWDLHREPPTIRDNSGYEPCYSGSNDCN